MHALKALVLFTAAAPWPGRFFTTTKAAAAMSVRRYGFNNHGGHNTTQASRHQDTTDYHHKKTIGARVMNSTCAMTLVCIFYVQHAVHVLQRVLK